MKKKLSWSVLLGFGIVAWLLARLVGGIAGDLIGLLADILIALGVVNLIVHLVTKNKKSTTK